MSYWEDRLGHRPPVSVNIEHLLDLAGRDPLLLRSSLDEIEIGFSAILEKFEHDSHGRGHLMAVGDPLGALLQSFLAEQALDRGSRHLLVGEGATGVAVVEQLLEHAVGGDLGGSGGGHAPRLAKVTEVDQGRPHSDRPRETTRLSGGASPG